MTEQRFLKTSRLLKSAPPEAERFILGVVLEPDTVDAQGDIYSAEEIRRAAHAFMEQFQTIGLMHRLAVSDQVKILESYLVPSDFSIDNESIPAGSWLLAVRILSDELWAKVQEGGLTRFSVGGSAERVLITDGAQPT